MIYLHIFTEGDSEDAYINKLRQFISKNALTDDFTLIYDSEQCINGVGQGPYTESKIAGKIKKEITESLPKKEFWDGKDIIIWIDYDIFKKYKLSQDKLLLTIKSKFYSANINIYYNHMNFEDFFVLHFPDKINKWQEVCKSRNHFEDPLKGEDHLKLFKENIFPKYNKRTLLPGFNITKKNLEEVIKSSKSSTNNFKSDIVELLEKVLSKLDS
ncbi:MAG: hypothetical protein GY793_05470 [Proteobacteria bacterium]|nr:hypothetical protein [Pseudomonadota bacterium]